MRVLVAEDDFTNRRLLEVTLRRWGYDVALATNGLQAWQILQNEDAPPLVVLDWMMPGMDGIEICRRMRAAAPARLVYIIMVTARAQGEDLVAALEAGADDYVTKPFQHAELRARVRAGERMLETQLRLAQQEKELAVARALIAEQERFDAAVSAMSDGVVTLDAEWQVAAANRAACLLLDLPAGRCQGMPLAEALCPFVLSHPLADLQTSDEKEAAFEISRAATRPQLYIDARLTRLSCDDGRAGGAVLVLHDITAERRAQRVRADFFTMISHKLRTPLTVLSGFLQVLRHLPQDTIAEGECDILDVCLTHVRHLDGLVGDLLDFKALGARAGAGDVGPVELASAVDTALAAARARYPAKSIAVRSDIDPDAGLAAIYADDLALVFAKLLDNAAKFGGEAVQVEIRAALGEAGRVQVTVSDNGPGIPHEYHDRIFEPFLQVEDLPTGQVPGLGLGLFIARQVVAAYGGTLTVRSRLGQGSTFTLQLPAPRDDGESA